MLVHEGGKGYEVEFTTLDGETIAVVTLNAKQVRQVNRVRSRMCATWRLILELFDFASDGFDWLLGSGSFLQLLDRVAISDIDNLLDALPLEYAELTDRRFEA